MTDHATVRTGVPEADQVHRLSNSTLFGVGEHAVSLSVDAAALLRGDPESPAPDARELRRRVHELIDDLPDGLVVECWIGPAAGTA